MKKFITICLLLITAALTAHATINDEEPIELKTQKKTIGPRSLTVIPANAHLNTDSSILYINIDPNVTVLSVSVTNIETGEIIYLNTQQIPENILIPLADEETGIYCLEIMTTNERIWGDFAYGE